MAERLGLPEPVADAADLLVYQVLLRDRTAITDLVRTVLDAAGSGPRRGGTAAGHPGGLLLPRRRRRRGSEGPASVGPRGHLPPGPGQGSDRTVTRRLPADALTLQVAVIGARLLDWPATPLAAG